MGVAVQRHRKGHKLFLLFCFGKVLELTYSFNPNCMLTQLQIVAISHWFLNGRVFSLHFFSEWDAAAMTQMPGFAVVVMNGILTAPYAQKSAPEKVANQDTAFVCGWWPYATISFWGFISVWRAGNVGYFIIFKNHMGSTLECALDSLMLIFIWHLCYRTAVHISWHNTIQHTVLKYIFWFMVLHCSEFGSLAYNSKKLSTLFALVKNLAD